MDKLKTDLEAAEETVTEYLERNDFEFEESYQKAFLDEPDRKRLNRDIQKFAEAIESAASSAADAKRAREEAARARDSAAKQVEDDERRQDKELSKQGFISVSDWSDSCRSEEERSQDDQEIRTYDNEVSAAKDRKKRANKAAEGLEPMDLLALETAVSEAEKSLNETREQRIGTSRRRNDLNGIQAALDQLGTELTEADGRFRVAASLADTAAGKPEAARGMTLHRYVLTFLLEQVMGIANRHLSVLASDRYRLQRDEDQERVHDGGLGILVHDSWTSENRSAKTLSGGETFLASLALALGLAEAVQQQAGAITLDTIFIDEGFGSLDPETVDKATEALFRLREQGRLLGVISHVDVMRQQIPNRLEVIKTNRGSTARFILQD